MRGTVSVKSKVKTGLKIALAVLILAAVVALCVWLIPLVASLREPDIQAEFREFIESMGILGVVAMFLLQVTQIVVAVIPGEPIEILMGLMYGTFGGLALTLSGIALGQTLVFFAVKRFGINFAKRFVNVEKFEELNFIKDSAKRDSLIFLLFFIPGTPKDILTYFAPFTGIKFSRFIIMTTLARIPSVVSSTWAGATMSDGNIVQTIIIFAVTGVIGIAGILLNNKLTKRQNI